MSALSGEKEATQAKHKRKYVWILPVKTNKISKKVNLLFWPFYQHLIGGGISFLCENPPVG